MESLEARPKDIVIERDRLRVKSFETADKEVVAYFQDIEAGRRMERFENVIRTGVLALKTVGITERIDYIQKEFMRMNNEFNASVDKTLEQLDDKLEEIFGEDGQFSEVVKEHFGEDGKVVKELFNPAKDGTPLNVLRNEIRGEISGLKTELKLDSQKEAIEKKTPLKGWKFEDLCESFLSDIAKHSGDVLERTSDVAGRLRPSKKGDFVIQLMDGSKRIVFEVKDIDNKVTFPTIQKSLNEAM
ncbi:MAG: hypothetical protein ACREBU_19145, partial [Nitrososphaera sp.]